jgi:anthranilate phosphoribosyltransferase
VINPLSSALATVTAGNNLSVAQIRAAIGTMLDGEASDAEMAALLLALQSKGETADELEGAVSAVRERMIRWDSGMTAKPLLDTCGTGGDGANTVNISTAAAIVVAACGVSVVKHGNRAATSSSGSSDVLSALGVAADLEPVLSRRCLSELKIAFLFAPRFHPGMARVAPVRRQLRFRTIFNLVGPLCNPACPTHQLAGVPTEIQAELLAQVIARQSHLIRAAVVTGCDGLDEVTLDGPTQVRIIDSGDVRREIWEPEDFGLPRSGLAAIKVRNPVESAASLRRAFEGEKSPVRDYILANSAAALWVTGQCSLREGTGLAASAIDSGAATRLLDRWRQLAPASPAVGAPTTSTGRL